MNATMSQAPAVDWHHDSATPAWFVDAMRKLEPNPAYWNVVTEESGNVEEPYWESVGDAAMAVFEERFRQSLDWLDHSGWSVKGNGQVVFVSEPYGLRGDMVKHLMDVVNACDFALNISATSHHYPGRTLRIEISPKAK